MKRIVLPGILAGILMLAVGMGLTNILQMAIPSLAAEYNNISLFRPWSDPLMSLFFIYPFLLGIILAFAWEKTKGLFKGTYARKAVMFGLAYWLVSSVPGMFITYSSFQVSLMLVTAWTVSGLIDGILAGLVFGKLNP